MIGNAKIVITDSGGIQEEAAFLSKKIFTIRDNTERPSTINAGYNELINIDNIDSIYMRYQKWRQTECNNLNLKKLNEFYLWDEKVGRRIAKEIKKYYFS